MNESELQKKVDRDALIVGARKAIKRAEQKKFDSQSKQPKMVKAFDKRTGKERFVLQSDIMRNPSGFTPISGSVADMLRVSDRKKENRRIRKGRDRNLRIERLKLQGLGSKTKPTPGKTKKITEGASPRIKSIFKKAAEREPGGRLSRADIELVEKSLKNKFKIGSLLTLSSLSCMACLDPISFPPPLLNFLPFNNFLSKPPIPPGEPSIIITPGVALPDFFLKSFPNKAFCGLPAIAFSIAMPLFFS